MFRWVEHTAELELEIQAPTEAGVFEDALAGLAELISSDHAQEPSEHRVVAAHGSDRPALLAAWLEELVFLAESEGFEPVAVQALTLSADSVRADVTGRLGEPPPIVKAITYHRLEFRRSDSGYCATVVLDV